MTKICVSIAATSLQQLKHLLEKALYLADFFEIRFDFLDTSEIANAMKIVYPFKSKSVFTIRSNAEQGKFSGNEKERVDLIKFLSDSHPLFMDVEISTLDSNPSLYEYLHNNSSSLLVSWHNFEYTPPNSELEEKMEKMKSYSNILKIVTMAKNARDALRLLELYNKYPDIKLISFAMGDLGIISRILCTLVGNSPFSYASLQKPIAPGQLSVKEMRQIYERIERHFSRDVI